MIKMDVKGPKTVTKQCDKKKLEVLSNELKVRIRGAVYGFVHVHYQSNIFAQKVTLRTKFNFDSIFYVRYKSEEISPDVSEDAAHNYLKMSSS